MDAAPVIVAQAVTLVQSCRASDYKFRLPRDAWKVRAYVTMKGWF